MPTTAIPVQTTLGGYPATLPLAANSADFTWTAADVANGNHYVSSGDEIVLINNTGASPYTVTVTSQKDAFGRTGDITAYSLAAGDFAMLGPFPNQGWANSAGQIAISAENVAVTFAIIRPKRIGA